MNSTVNIDKNGRTLIEQAKNAINIDKSNSTRDEKIEIAMNKLYNYFSSYPEEKLRNCGLQRKIYDVEDMLENEFLPINSEPIYDPNFNEQFPNQIITKENCETALKFIVHSTRKELSRSNNLKIDTLRGKCINISGLVEDMCEKRNIDFQHLGLDENLEYGFYHHFTIANFHLKNGEDKKYIIDCAYRQFFTKDDSFIKRIAVMRGPVKGSSIGTYMMMTDKRKEIAEQLLTKGYIEATSENLKEYLDAIIFSGRDNEYYEAHGLDYMNPSDCIPNYSIEDYNQILINNGLVEKSIYETTNEILSSNHYITFSDLKKVSDNKRKIKEMEKNRYDVQL